MLKDDEIRGLIMPFTERTGGVISALREILQAEGFIDPVRFPVVADVFNLSVAEVRGIASFYEDFRTHPPAKNIVRVCQAEACQSLGARALLHDIKAELVKREVDAITEVEVLPVYCLGLCAIGPAVQINGNLLGRAKVKDLERIL